MSLLPSDKQTVFHTAIIGGGAAGLFCAGSFDADKIVLEALDKPALKVSISGGGKCNFSNRFVTAADYRCNQKHFCKNALAAFKPIDFIGLLDRAYIPWEERDHGRLFTTTSARDIVNMLIKRAKEHHTRLVTGGRVLDIRQEQNLFVLRTSLGTIKARHVVLATGGLSYPELGGNHFVTKMAQTWNLPVVEQQPALCGLTLPKPLRNGFSSLAGNTLPARVTCGKHIEDDYLLFTHEGFSGPVILQTSLFWQPGQPVEIDFLPTKNVATLLSANKNSSRLFSQLIMEYFPSKKIAKVLLGKQDRDVANASRAELNSAAKRLNHFTFVPTGTSGYTKAEVTTGGIDTRAINPSTMQVRSIPNLYIVGEALDVTGRMGGFNLHWAWCSAYAAAQFLKNKF